MQKLAYMKHLSSLLLKTQAQFSSLGLLSSSLGLFLQYFGWRANCILRNPCEIVQSHLTINIYGGLPCDLRYCHMLFTCI